MENNTLESNWVDELVKKFGIPDDEEYNSRLNPFISFISNLLQKKDHDHEILVNTILETKNQEREQEYKKGVKDGILSMEKTRIEAIQENRAQLLSTLKEKMPPKSLPRDDYQSGWNDYRKCCLDIINQLTDGK